MSFSLYSRPIRQEWTFHQNPDNPRFPQEIIDLIFSHYIEMQLSLHPFEPVVETACTRNCEEYCWCHFWDLNAVELKQASLNSRAMPYHVNYSLPCGMSPTGILHPVNSRAAETAEIVQRKHRHALPLKAIKRRRWHKMITDEAFDDPSFEPLGEYPTVVKDDDVVFLMYHHDIRDTNGNIWFNRKDLPIAFGPGMPTLRRVAMDVQQLESIEPSDVEQWARNMDRYHLWNLSHTKNSKRRKLYSGKSDPATDPLRVKKAWRPSGEKTGLHLVPRADDLEEEIDDPEWPYDGAEPTEVFRPWALDFMEDEYARWDETRGQIGDVVRETDMGDVEAKLDEMSKRMFLYTKQRYWEDKHLEQLNSRPNKPMRRDATGPELFIHDFLPDLEELFIIMPHMSPMGGRLKTREYLQSYSLGDVDPHHEDPQARDYCRLCICKHDTRPMVFGGAADFRYVEIRACRPDVWGQISSSNLTKTHLEMWSRWLDIASTWDTEVCTKPFPQIRFLGTVRVQETLF